MLLGCHLKWVHDEVGDVLPLELGARDGVFQQHLVDTRMVFKEGYNCQELIEVCVLIKKIDNFFNIGLEVLELSWRHVSPLVFQLELFYFLIHSSPCKMALDILHFYCAMRWIFKLNLVLV